MKTICTDLAAEQQALDAIVADLDEPEITGTFVLKVHKLGISVS
jgi:hypothetical protein